MDRKLTDSLNLNFSLRRIDGIGEGFRLITPDVVAFVASLVFAILLRLNKIFSKEYEGYAKQQMSAYIPNGPSTLNSLGILSLMFLNGLAFASGLQAVYFVVFQAVLVGFAFFRLSLFRLIDIIYWPIFLYDVTHILGVYVIQADPIRTRISSVWADALGFKFYDVDITPNPLMGVTICLSWASSIILLILLAFRRRNMDLRALTRMDRSYLPGNGSGPLGIGRSPSSAQANSTSTHTRPSRFWRLFRRAVRSWGWRICVVGLLAIPLFLPSFFSVLLLITACIASVVPQATLEKYWVVPAVTVYLILITSMQYIYNIPSVGASCEVGQMDLLCATGLRVFPYTWFQIGLQTLGCVLLSVNWGYYITQDDADRQDITRRKKNKQLDEDNLLYSTDSDVTEGLLLSDQEALDADRGHHHRRQSSRRSSTSTGAVPFDHHTSTGPESAKRRRGAPGSGHSNHSSDRGSNRSYGNDRFAVWSGDDRGSEYHTFASEPSLGVDDFERSASRSHSLKTDEPTPPKGRCGACWHKLSQWWQDFRPVLKAVGFWALKQSYLLSLGGVYIAGLHQVTILNSMYLLLFILFLISPSVARRFWLGLVLYCETVILVVYTWSATPWTANIHAPRILSMIGLRTYTTTNDLFTQGLVWHLVIMLFGVIQLWVLRYTASLAQSGKDKPTEKIPRWMRSVGDTFFWAWDEYGLVPVYTVLIFVASSDGDISLINILYITLLFVCLSIHMMTRHADVHIKRFWIFVVIASGVILLARYAYQFPFIQEIMQNLLQQEWIITGIGFIVFDSQTVFVPLLGNTFVFLVAVIQLQTFFAKKESSTGVGHNAHARRLATAADFEFESDTGMESSDWDDGSLGRHTLEASKPSSLPGSFKFGNELTTEDSQTIDLLHDDEHVPLGTSVPSRGFMSSRQRQHVHFDKATSSKITAVSEDEARLLAERGASARAERQVSASQHLLMDPELMAEDILKHPSSTLRARKRRLKRKHVLETIFYIWSLDIIYWLKRFCMLHAYKISALVMMAIAAKAPSGLNSVYVEIVILSVSADHLTDGVGLLLLLYTQLTVLFMLIYQFDPVHNALSAYFPLIQWAGFEYLPKNRLHLILSRLAIICMLLLQRFSHRWKNDWFRVKKIEVEHELEPVHMENVELHYSQLMAKHGAPDYDSPPVSINTTGDSANIKAAAEKLHQFSSQGSMMSSDEKYASDAASGEPAVGLAEDDDLQPTPIVPAYLTSPAHANSRYGILQQLQALLIEDERDNEAIEALKKRYLHKTELTLFLYDSSDFLVMKDHFSLREAWNLVAWFLSNLLLLGGYPVLVCAILMVIWVHKETVYGIIFLLILGLTIVTSRVKWASNGFPIKALTVYVALEILLQYILNLDLPPPDLRYPWSSWSSAWLAWLGLKQMDVKSGMLIADFVLLMVLSRLRRISTEDIKQLQWSRYWHYLVGPVTRHPGEAHTWRDSVRYAVYRFSPFVILLLIFIAGTVHPDILSLIYVFFALLFIFRESTIYSQRNRIWRWARLYNYFLMLVIIVYQVPIIKGSDGYMSVPVVLGLRKFSQRGSSILFSLFIFVLLGIQKRLFSRVEFDELVLNILDTEERGVRFAQERFQEWKMERRREFERVQEEKTKRRQQLDFLKAARTRQQKIWLRLAKGGAVPGTQDATLLHPSSYPSANAGDTAMLAAAHTAASAAAANAVGATPTAQPTSPPLYSMQDPYHPAMDYVHDPRMRTITSRDLKMMQSSGGLAIEENPQSKEFKLKFFTPSASTTHVPSTTGVPHGMMPSTSSRQLPFPSLQKPSDSSDDLSEIVVHQRALSPLSGTETTDQEGEDDGDEKKAKRSSGDESESEAGSESESDAVKHAFGDDDEGDGEEDVLAAALQESRKPGEVSFGEDDDIEPPTCCRCWKTPQFVITASEAVIAWVDRQTDGYVSTKPHYSRKGKLWAGFYKLYQINSSSLCYLTFIINAAVNSDVISLFYPISMFLYALLETPRPHKLYWNTVFVYAAITILIKFFYQLSIFCICHSERLEWALMSTCTTDPRCLNRVSPKTHTQFRFSAPRVTGITSYSSEQGGTSGPFILHVVPDLLVLVSVFMHRYWLKKLGYWNFVQRLILSKEGSDEPMSQKQLYEEAKRFEQILLKQQKKRENWTKYAAQKRKRRYNKRMEAIAKAGVNDIETAAHLGEYWDNAGAYDDVTDFAKYGDTSNEKSTHILRYYTDDSLGRPDSASPTFGPGDDSMEAKARLTHTTSSGLKVVTNPLFKVGESDFETDTEEMTPFGQGAARGATDVPQVLPSNARRSTAHASLGEGPSSVTDILGVNTSDQATRRKLDDISSPARPTSSMSRRTDTSEEDEEYAEEDRSETTSDRDVDSISDDGSDLSSTLGHDDEEENLYADTTSLRRRRAISNAKRWFKGRWKDTKNFFENLVAHKPGRDWYVQIWFVELVCFFFIIILPSPFIGNSGGNVVEFLTQSRLPNSYVLTLLAQFILIVIERILYLLRAIRVKVAYHVLLVVLYHVWLLFVSPIFTDADFNTQPILISFYLLKMIYLYLSSMQIMHGYPAFVQGQFITDSDEPGIPRWLVYIGYRAIPFVYELRTLLDWTITKTSLTFFEWLKLEDVYANLFLVKCRVSQDKVMKRNVGDPQEWYVKWGMGVLLFVGLSALIWFPLLLLMQGSPGNQPNPIVAATVSVGFTGYASPIYTAVAVGSNMKNSTDLGSTLFSQLRSNELAVTYDDSSILQWIEFDNFSDASWLISPPAKAHLLQELEDYVAHKPGSHPNTITVTVSFTRQAAITTSAVADYSIEVPIDSPLDVIHAINGSRGNFTIQHLMPRYYRIPNSGPATSLNSEKTSDFKIGANFELGSQDELFWNCRSLSAPGKLPWDNQPKLMLVTFSAEAPKGILRSLASVGLIGLYVGVVLAVARFLRLSVTDLAFRIIYEDMPACDELISYCEDIYLARQDGDLVLEEELFRELIEIYRSPETIIGRTIRTHPRFGGRPMTKREKKRLLKENPLASDQDQGNGGNGGPAGGATAEAFGVDDHALEPSFDDPSFDRAASPFHATSQPTNIPPRSATAGLSGSMPSSPAPSSSVTGHGMSFTGSPASATPPSGNPSSSTGFPQSPSHPKLD